MRYALQLAYKGTHFHGWQIQENAYSVQEEINGALEIMLKHSVKSQGSGRTDTGVHAKEQFIMFDSDEILESYRDLKTINALISKDIVCYGLYEISDNASLRYDAIMRSYEYRICRRRDPFEREFSALLLGEIDRDKMNRGTKYLLTQKNFKSFSKSGSDAKSGICHLAEANWDFNGHIWTFNISADRFLRNMVRAIVGTLVELGEGKISFEDFTQLFLSDKRSNAGRSMPAEGLFLKNVKYPEGYFKKI